MEGALKFGAFASSAMIGLVAFAAPGAKGSEPPPLDVYGDLPGIERMAISPSGAGLAIVGRNKGQRQLVVLDGERKLRAMVPASDAKIRSLEWAGEDAVTIEISKNETLGPIFLADKAEMWGALVVPLDGAKPWMVFDKTQGMANVIYGAFGTRLVQGKWQGFWSGIEYGRVGAAASIIGSNQILAAVDFKGGSIRRLARLSASGHRRAWLIDGNGNVGATFDIADTSGSWDIVNTRGAKLAAGADLTGDVGMVGFGQDGSSMLYWKEDDTTGQVQYFEVPLAGGETREVFANLNIDQFFKDPTNGQILGYRENGASNRMTFFDPARQMTARKVARAFPKLQVDIRDWTTDFRKLLVRTSGNGDSGSWYMIDMTLMKADIVGDERPLIPPSQVGPVSTIAYKASDGLDLDGVLTLPPGRAAKNLPVILFPHGGPASHDKPVFDWWAQAFASRGYAVFQPNFRGSDNRDQTFLRAGYGQWGRKMQTDISDGLAELSRQGIVNPKRACIMGGSYGGFAALAGVTLQQGIYRCAVSIAGVSDLTDLYNTRTSNSSSKMTWRSMRESYGQPSSFNEVSPRRHAANAHAPILLIHGKDDTVVEFGQSSAMADALKVAGKPHELVVLQNEDHWLSRADTRKEMLRAAMRFVQQHNPAD
jgi:acetyl esterase/lipase